MVDESRGRTGTPSTGSRRRPERRDRRLLWAGVALFGSAAVFGFGLALWVAVLGGDWVLAAGWRFAVTCLGGSV